MHNKYMYPAQCKDLFQMNSRKNIFVLYMGMWIMQAEMVNLEACKLAR